MSSHKSALVTDYCRGKMELVYITTYSCQFNSIETYWAYAKRRFKKINFNMKGNYKDGKEFNKKVKESLEISKEQHHNICAENRHFIEKIIGDWNKWH